MLRNGRWLPVLVLVGCSSSTGGAQPPADSSVNDTHVEVTADDGGTCGTPTNDAPEITVSEQIGTTPTGTGGTLTDGLWFTTAEVHYRAAASDPTSRITKVRETVMLWNASPTGADGAYVFLPDEDPSKEERVAVHVSTKDSLSSFDVSCPTPAKDATFDTFTATPTTLTLFSSKFGLAVSLTKQ